MRPRDKPSKCTKTNNYNLIKEAIKLNSNKKEIKNYGKL